jgi:preprotein translocase subunit SecG
MEMFETLIVVLHVIVSLGLIGLILIQQGKGAEAGASFGGGASQTVFGSQGSANFLTKTTKYLAIIFFVTSISLAVIAKQRSEVAAQELLPTAGQVETVKESVELEAASDADQVKIEAVEPEKVDQGAAETAEPDAGVKDAEPAKTELE